MGGKFCSQTIQTLLLFITPLLLILNITGEAFALNEQLYNPKTQSWIWIALAVLFIYSGIAVYYLFFRFNKNHNLESGMNDKNRESQKYWRYFYVLIGVAFLFRVVIAPLYQGFYYDYGMFKYWADVAANNLWKMYHPGMAYIDYPPVYIAVLAVVGNIIKLLQMAPDSWSSILMLKLPTIIAELITGYILFKLAQKYLDLRKALILSAIYLFNPAVWFDTLIWGQVDSFFLLMVLAVCWFIIEGKLGWAASFMAVAILTKPQGFIFVPMFLFELIRTKKLKTIFYASVAGLGTFIAIILPFTMTNPDPFWWYKLLFKMTGNFPYASVNAFNFFALAGGNWVNDGEPFLFLTYKTWGDIFLVLIVAFTGYLYWKHKSRFTFLLAALILNAGAYNLSSRMHERYLFPAMILALLIYIFYQARKALHIYLWSTITSFLNIFLVFIPVATTDVSKSENAWVCWISSKNPLVWITALCNLVLLIYITLYLFRFIHRVNSRHDQADHAKKELDETNDYFLGNRVDG